MQCNMSRGINQTAARHALALLYSPGANLSNIYVSWILLRPLHSRAFQALRLIKTDLWHIVHVAARMTLLLNCPVAGFVSECMDVLLGADSDDQIRHQFTSRWLALIFNLECTSQVVPEAVRTSVYAFDKCIIGALGAVTTPLAGLLAEKVFGFVHVSAHKQKQHAGGGHAAVRAPAPAGAAAALPANNLNNARALENGLLCIMLVSCLSPPVLVSVVRSW